MQGQAEDDSAPQQEVESASNRVQPPVLSKDLADKVLQLVLDNIHEGKEGRKLTTHQAAQTFMSLCALIVAQNAAVSTKSPVPGTSNSGAGLDWPDAAMKQLLSQSVTKKSRYSLLNVLVPYVGAFKMITHRPALVHECLQAMQADTCTVATAFLRELLSTRKSELAQQPSAAASSQQQSEHNFSSLEASKGEWRALWMQPVVNLLRSRDVNFRGKLVNYCLPMLLELDPESLPDLLQLQMQTLGDQGTSTMSSKGQDTLEGTAAIAGTIAVLSAARTMHLFDSLDAVVEDEAGRHHVPHSLLAVAAVHKDESLRIQTLELAALSVKTTSVRS